MIGLVFGFSVLWKAVLSPDFLDGTFFRVMLLSDPRFEDFVRLTTGMGSDQIEWQRAALGRHVDGGMLALYDGSWPPPVAFDRLAVFMTGWTLAIEGLIALLFCLSLGRASLGMRDWALLVFCGTTYAVAPVAGFAWLLIAMGVSQSERERGRLRAAYVACFGLVLFYREVAWAGMLADWLGQT